MTTALASAGADIVSIELPNDPGSENTSKIVKSCGRKYSSYECDVSNLKSIRSTYQKIWSDGVKADIVLNCAGVQRRAEAADFTDEDIDAVIDINIKATLVSCQEFAKKNLAEGRPGKVINIASIISFIGGKNITPYAASKGGVMQVTKAMSNEWAEKGYVLNNTNTRQNSDGSASIQCNSIHPGYFRTAMTEQYSTGEKTFSRYVFGLTKHSWAKC